ncbi:MAG: hypothetical protein ACXWUG_26590 [Polyangiales bacterium]
MSQRSVLVLFALSLVVPVGCKKKTDDAVGKSEAKSSEEGGGKKKHKKADDDDKESEGEDEKPKAKGKSACKFPENASIEADLTLPKGCKLKVKDSLTVKEGVTLTIEPGAKVSFEGDTYLSVRGRLVAKGTDDDPVVFTSANDGPGAGDWQGILFDDGAMTGQVIDHAVIEYAGKSGGYAHGAISVNGDVHPGRITITNSKIQHNGQAGVWNDHEKASFAKLEGNTFKDNGKDVGGASINVYANILGSVGSNKLGGDALRIHGDILQSQTWAKFDAPVMVTEAINVKGVGQAAILKIAEGTTVKFAQDTYIWFGAGDGSGLVAKGVTFTSANATPAEGDWVGIGFDDKGTSTTIEDCTFEYSGRSGSYGHAVITFNADMKKLKNVKVTNCTFKKNDAAAFWSQDEVCPSFASDNKSTGKPLCKKAE